MERVWFLIGRGRVDFRELLLLPVQQWSIATVVGRMFPASRRRNEGDCCQTQQQSPHQQSHLSSTGLRPVLHTLKKFYSDLTQESMEELFPGGLICRSCVRVIEV